MSKNRERGASLVEFALVAPLLIVLVFGVIEFSWAFAQANDVRHGAREAARLAAVDFGSHTVIGTEVCDRMDLGVSTVVSVQLSGVSGTGDRGSTGNVLVTQTYSTLTGIFDSFLAGKSIASDIEFRLEQPTDGSSAAWWGGGTHNC